MNVPACFVRKAEAMILAGAILFAPIIASAQQEVSPDHFDGADAAARKARPAQRRKPVVAVPQINAKRRRNAQAKKNADRQKVLLARDRT